MLGTIMYQNPVINLINPHVSLLNIVIKLGSIPHFCPPSSSPAGRKLHIVGAEDSQGLQ